MSEPIDTWTIKAALDWTVGFLERKGDEHARLSAEWLLSEATGLRRIDLYVNFERPLSMDNAMFCAVSSRVALRASLCNTSRARLRFVISPSRFARAS